MIKRLFVPKLVASFLAIALFTLASQSARAATIVIQNSDKPNEGFNDPTPVTPVGNNTGTTLGQQRLNAFQFAANIWGAMLNSSVTIVIDARWPNSPNDPDPLNRPLSCSSSKATLGSAGTISIFANFPNAPQAGTWYSGALANSLAGSDLDSTTAEIRARFNPNLGTPGCLDNSPFYLGLDNNHGSGVDLVTVLLHEFSHGLGFQTFTDPSTGTQAGSTTKRPSIFDNFLFDNSTNKTWTQMTTDAERKASAINTGHLTWNGPLVTSLTNSVLGTPRLRVNSPPAVAGNYTVGTADFGSPLNSGGVTGTVVQALDPSDGAGALTTDGCSALTNAAAVSGKIALIDRGTCSFVIKVKNAQNAGAIGVIIGNSTTGVIEMGGGDPSITITTVMVSQSDATNIRAQSNVNATLLIDTSVSAGADGSGRPLMYAPSAIELGSSVSHWDTSEFPNQLMEPNISGDLTHSVAQPLDLTVAQLRDVGWSANPIGDIPFFVRQQYLDFLNRQPDSSGFAFWTNNIFNCGIDQQCAEVHRINASAAFFLSIEFQDTGNLVYKMWKAGFNNVSGTPVAVRRANFIRDMQTIQSTPNQIIVGQGNWQANLEANKQAFALSFVQRAGFPNQSDAAAFVDNLFANAGVTPTSNERAAAINAFNGAGGGNAGRAAALRSVCDSASVTSALRNEAFVLMQYFGYLQRDPDAQTPADYSGFQFWLNKLNSFNGDFIGAEMVKAFLNSTEYRARFGNP